MWVISLRNKALIALSVLTALLLAALGYLSLRCEEEQYGRLLLAKSAAAHGLSPQQIEDFCAEEFLITYEIERAAMAQAHSFRLPVAMIGTNSCYAQVMGYRMLAGGFFSSAAWQAGNRAAVLNRAAAFQLFGNNEVTGQTLKLEGANWLVSGVLDDGDAENPRVYVPAGVMEGNVGSLLVLLDDNLVNADYAVNGLKQLGVYDSNYTIVNLAAVSAAFGQRLTVGLRLLLMLFILLLSRQCAGWLFRRLPLYREQFKQLYLRELLAAHRAGLAKTALAAIALLGGIAALITLGLQILAICLTWPNLLPQGHAWAMGSFANKLNWLHTWHIRSIILFVLLLIAQTLVFATIRRDNS